MQFLDFLQEHESVSRTWFLAHALFLSKVLGADYRCGPHLQDPLVGGGAEPRLAKIFWTFLRASDAAGVAPLQPKGCCNVQRDTPRWCCALRCGSCNVQ